MQFESFLLLSLAKLTGKTNFYKYVIKKRISNVDKLNIGCGDNFVENWLNIGLFNIPQGIYLFSKTKKQTLIINYDMTKEFPIEPDSINYIYASHFIEHLSFIQGINFLKNCYKVMKKGGLIRLVFPDLELWIKKYYENESSFFNKYYEFTKNINKLPELKTKGEIFMSQFYCWNHKWCYDFDSIKDIFE
ncbi:MAG: hypothetical protein QHH15_03770 [Candidatus Thermoplasmatota archaeon]|nr:hypothetical protein [Candidatus Thermoplasmatota archaeon]